MESWRAVLRGRVGSRQQRSIWVKSRTSRQLQIAQGHGSQKKKDFCKVQASLKTSHLLSSASRSLPDKCGLRGLVPFMGRAFCTSSGACPHGERGLPGTKASLLQLHPFCFYPLFLIRARVWLWGLSVNGKALHSDGSHTSHAHNLMESLLNCKPKPRGLGSEVWDGAHGSVFLTSSQLLLLLQGCGPHFELHCHKASWTEILTSCSQASGVALR